MKITYNNFKRKIIELLIMQIIWPTLLPAAEQVDAQSIECPTNAIEVPKWPRSQSYKNMPFQPGEEIRYELKYSSLRVHVGYGFMRVGKPVKHKIPIGKKGGDSVLAKRWHRSFSVEAYTGDWYKAIFRAHDKLLAYSRPWDFGVSKFYISEDHDKAFGKRTRREKWLDFNHVNCLVSEREVNYRKNREKSSSNPIVAGAVDALGAAYQLRTFKYELNKPKKFIVYTSQKNWWLEATPVALESVETKLGKFTAYKLKVATSLGQDLEQKRSLSIWIAADHPQSLMLKVEGEAKFGSFYLEVDQFKPGS